MHVKPLQSSESGTTEDDEKNIVIINAAYIARFKDNPNSYNQNIDVINKC